MRWLLVSDCGFHGACRLPRSHRLHQQSLSGGRPRQEGPLFLVQRGAQDPRSRSRLHHRRARHHRQRLRHAARISLPRAALSTHRRPRRGRARAPATAGRPASLPLRDPPGRPVPCRSLLCTEPRRTADQSGHRRGFRLRAGAHRRPRRQQPRHQQLRAGAGLCRLQQAADRAAPNRQGVRRASRAPAVRPRRWHRRRGRARRPCAGNHPGRAQRADPLLVRHALHDAAGVGGGGLLRREGGSPALCRSCGRHGALSAFAVREAVPLHAGAQRAVVRQPANEPRCAGRHFPCADRPRGHCRGPHRCRIRRPAHALRRPHRVLPRAGEHSALQQAAAGLL